MVVASLGYGLPRNEAVSGLHKGVSRKRSWSFTSEASGSENLLEFATIESEIEPQVAEGAGICHSQTPLQLSKKQLSVARVANYAFVAQLQPESVACSIVNIGDRVVAVTKLMRFLRNWQVYVTRK